MCATFQLSGSDAAEIKNICDELTKKYGKEAADKAINKDFYPKSEVPVIGGNDKLALLKWGFPLHGKSDTVFNARAESLSEKRMYKDILGNRCLVPATCFYEWDKAKRKYRLTMSNSKLFYMAALWKEEKHSDGLKAFYFTIITTEPNDLIGTIHNRMPAIISFKDTAAWLRGKDEAFSLLKPYREEMSMIAI
jgi:putative SOS response-associated peptidase YedK